MKRLALGNSKSEIRNTWALVHETAYGSEPKDSDTPPKCWCQQSKIIARRWSLE
jgi:hypothetical protein